MYLSRIVLSARSLDARAWLGDCYKLHRQVMSGFPEAQAASARAEFGVLFRVEPMTTPPYVPVLVQSRVEPKWQFETDAVVRVEGPKPLSALLDGICAGRRYRFRLRANPTRRVHARATLDADPAKGRMRPEKTEAEGKRVELTREADQVAWLERQARRAGFGIVSVRRLPDWPDAKPDLPSLVTAPASRTRGERHGARLTLASVVFEGALEVTDPEAFRTAVQSGVGPGKAFGCGLLSVAPIP
jgi:CRISPR system Cascade subunit CasE